MPLTVYELFRLIDAANSTAAEAAPGTPVTTYTVRLAMMEIYNEVCDMTHTHAHTHTCTHTDNSSVPASCFVTHIHTQTHETMEVSH